MIAVTVYRFDRPPSGGRCRNDLQQSLSILHDALIQFHQTEIPVVGAVNGVAAGAGFSLALFPDIVLVSDEARLDTDGRKSVKNSITPGGEISSHSYVRQYEYAYLRIGFTGDGGSTYFLPRLVGLRKAKEIFLLDEPIEPEEAVELGIATEVVPADDLEKRMNEVAQQLAEGPTTALGATKRLMTESFDRNLEGQLAAETEQIARTARTEDYARGYEAFFGEDSPDVVGY